MKSSITGRSFVCDAGKDAKLAEAIKHGHRWIILSEKVPVEDQLAISEWRNADQNVNQVRHELEIIRSVQRVVSSEAAKASQAMRV